jgi:transcriptional antiterminator NusG
MYRWYVVNTYSGHENKVKQNLEHRVVSLNQKRAVRQVVVPTETVTEMKDNQKVPVEKRTMPGYVLVNMELNDDSWQLVKGTPGVTGFVGASNEPVPLTQPEVDRLLHREVAQKVATKAQFSIGESVKVVSGPLSDFSGEISEISPEKSESGPEITLTDSPIVNCARLGTFCATSRCSRRSTSAWVSGIGSLEAPTNPVTPGVPLTTAHESSLRSMFTST